MKTRNPKLKTRNTTAAEKPLNNTGGSGKSQNPMRVIQSVRSRFNPIRGLTPEKLSKFLEAFLLGFFRDLAIAWDAMERRDDTLKTVAPKRYKSVARHGYEIVRVDEIPAGMESLADEQVARLKFFYDHVTATDAVEKDVRGGFSLLARQMMRSKGHKYAVHEIVWRPTVDGLTAEFIYCPLWWFEGTHGKLRFLPSEFAIYGEDMPEGEWLVTVGDGLMEAACVLYMFKHLPLKSWLAYLDKFGMPGLLGKTDSPPDSEEFEKFLTALRDFAEEWAAVVNNANSIDVIEPKGSTGDSGFEKLIERCDRGMTRLFRGGDLGTLSSKDATGASLQDDETEVLETDDARDIEETLGMNVSRFVLQYFFGDAPQLAYLRINTSEKQNVDQDLKVDEFLSGRKFPITLGSAAERYNRPLPEGTDPDEMLAEPTPEPKPGAKDDEAEIANESDETRALLENTLTQLITLRSPAARQLADRISGIVELTNEDAFWHALKNFQTELRNPQTPWLREFVTDPHAVSVFANAMSAGFWNGYAEEEVNQHKAKS